MGAGEARSGIGSGDAPPASRLIDGIWAAVVTPFREDGELDPDGIASNAAHYGEALGLTGIFCNGFMGEGWTLSAAERKRALEATLEGAGKKLRVGVVASHHSLGETIDLARHAEHAGADHVVLMRPAGLFSPDGLLAYVKSVADAVALPIVLFDAASQSGGFAPPLVSRLAEDGLVHGVKCTRDWDAVNALRAHCGDKIVIADPYEARFLANLIRFDLDSLYADPEPYLFQRRGHCAILGYHSAWRRGDRKAAMDLSGALEPLRRAYERWIIAPLTAGLPMNAALKHWCSRLGLVGGAVRAPTPTLTREEARSLDAELDAAFAAVFDNEPACARDVKG